MPEELDELADEILELNETIAHLEEKRKKLRSQMTEELLARGEDEVEGDEAKIKLVRPEKTIIDEVELAAKLGENWEVVTSRKLDKEKLERAVSKGIVDMKDVAACTELVPGTAYVTAKRKKKR